MFGVTWIVSIVLNVLAYYFFNARMWFELSISFIFSLDGRYINCITWRLLVIGVNSNWNNQRRKKMEKSLKVVQNTNMNILFPDTCGAILMSMHLYQNILIRHNFLERWYKQHYAHIFIFYISIMQMLYNAKEKNNIL